MGTKPGKVSQTAELLSLLCALLLVALIAGYAFRTWSAFNRASAQLAISQSVASNTNAVLSTLKDAETGQRGFLLTNRGAYLDPYQRARTEIPGYLRNLSAAAASRPDQMRRLEILQPLIVAKLDELAMTIQLRRTQGLEAALAVVLTNDGKKTMDRIRQICAEVQSASEQHLARESIQARASINELGVAGSFGSAALFVLLLISTIAIRRGTARREALIQALEQSEEQTRQARDWLQTTITSIGDGVIATDASGCVTFLNSVAQSLTAWSQAEAVGIPLESLFVIRNEETGATVENPVSKVLREGHVVGLANHTNLLAKDGRVIPIDDSAAPIRDHSGAIVGVVLVFRDIMHRRYAERLERQAADAMAAHAKVLERTNAELQHFAYAVSHDLREPLRTITAYSQLLKQGNPARPDAENAQFLEFILLAAQRMEMQIAALLEYSRAGEAAAESASILDGKMILAAALANLERAIEETGAMVTHDPLPALFGSEAAFVQLLQNLIGNAIKYRCEEAPRIHISAAEQSNEWLFSITDNGLGIAPQYCTQIFLPFKRLHGPEYPGAGIGLATCKKSSSATAGESGWNRSRAGVPPSTSLCPCRRRWKMPLPIDQSRGLVARAEAKLQIRHKRNSMVSIKLGALRMKILHAFAAFLAAGALVTPALAHHSFTMFDMTKRITLAGTVTSFEWTNPHSYIEIDAPDEKGTMKHWSIELGSPSILMQSGWKFSSLHMGDKVTLIINPLKSGQDGGFLYEATLPNGKVLTNGPRLSPPPATQK